jgi:gamma-glutamyl:cysteine ligase YbdK (ATP-grasp superfamily)
MSVPTSPVAPLSLFEAYGVELEYMIVDAQSLAVLPISDKVLYQVAGEYASQVDLPDVAWSNELVLHVIELKTANPAPALTPLAEKFQEHVERINELLVPLGGRLMPSAMHPWMDPWQEMRLWPHEYSPVYEAYHRIFDCRGHGWANLQSTHLNLPFADDEEFGRLHAAVRLLLPIMPALAASSPIMDRRLTGLMDNRLEVYRTNARRVPSCTGMVIPEPVYTQDEYQRLILQRMYDDIAPLDPEGVLQYEFLNSRGAIARFERNSIEIRVLDVQECPAADVAVCMAVTAVLKALVAERWMDLKTQQAFSTESLAALFNRTTRDAEQSLIAERAYLDLFGFPRSSGTAGDLWRHLVQSLDLLGDGDRAGAQPPLVSPERTVMKGGSCPVCEGPERGQNQRSCSTCPTACHSGLATSWREALRVILARGPLARRICNSIAVEADADPFEEVYRELCNCLAAGRMFYGCD